MSNPYNMLLSPMKVGSHTYKNRIVAAPIYCGTFALIPPLAKVLMQSVTEKARGGCAVVTIGETPVDFDYASREPFPPIDYSDFSHPAMALLEEATGVIHQSGALAMIELSHCGESKLAIAGAGGAIGPMDYTREDGVAVTAMDEALMQSVCDNFTKEAHFMREAGFDGVMLHAGHGWLLHQFLSARTNQRDDAYGGSLENRARFPLRVIRAVREAMGKDFLLEIRVSGDECTEGGMAVDEVAAFCGMAQEFVDLIHVSVGLYRDPVLSGQFSSLFAPHALNADMAKVIRDAVNIPVAVVGGVNEAPMAEALLVQGKCDLVAMARQLTADPDFAGKVQQGAAEDITPCLRCFKCFPGALEDNLDELANLFGCTVNPQAFFFDQELLNRMPETTKNVLVAGGGIAGMEAAIAACDRGHRVTLMEKSGVLGGLLRFTDHDNYKQDLRAFRDLMIRRVRERKIQVELNAKCTPGSIAAYSPDAVVVAVGSSPVTPPIPGIENALPALAAYADMARVGKRVVMVGGGLVGCEAGISMAKDGREVTVLEMGDAAAPDAYPMHRVGLLAEMDRMLTYHTGLRCTEIRPDGVTAVDSQGTAREFAADMVVYALGMRANSEEATALAQSTDVPVYVVGDCIRPAKVYDCMREAYTAALRI